MKTTISKFEFMDGLGDSFSYEGKERLYEFFKDYEEGIGEEIEYDPVAIRCDFTEMTLGEVIDAYGYMMDEEKIFSNDSYSYIMDFLNDRTMVCGDTPQGTIVFQQF